MKNWLIAVLCALASFTALALPTDAYEFKDEVMHKRYTSLVKELRCPKCQNQNLADSNSQIAVDLRREVYTMLMQGKSDGEIVQFMVERYGDFVLYRPKVNSLTYVLWFGPVVLVVIGLVIMVVVIRRKPEPEQEKELTAQQKQKIEDILKEK